MLRPPGPKPHFLIGNLPLAGRAPLDIFSQWAADYGDIFYYRAAWLHVYFLNRPDLIEYVLVRNSQNFLKDRVIQNSRWLLGSGLLTAEGESWKRQRRIIQPAFSRERLATYAQHMTSAAAEMLDHWKPGTTIDVHAQMMRLTLRVVVRALFDVETTGTEQISRALNTVMLHSIGLRLIMPPFFRYLPLPGMRSVRRAVDEMNRIVYELIASRRRSGRKDSADLLAMLMNTRDEDGTAMSDSQLRDEVMTFLLAGHETTALTLSWALYLLAQHPEVEARVLEEVENAIENRQPTMSDIGSLAYTESVLKETMRLYPPAWSVARTAIHEFELEGYPIPGGANIVASQWIMHRDRRYFSDPERFIPERWETSECQNLPRFAYFPFGGGPRQCVGASFAMTEAVLILASITQRYRLGLLDREPVEPVPGLTLRPSRAIPMRITRHSEESNHVRSLRTSDIVGQ
jgi:cytochrome P450